MPHPANTYSLVADIGGTNTRVALADGRKLVPGTVRRYANADYPGLETVLRRYIADEGGVDPKAACIAVAGPVRDGRATLTNLDWTMDHETLARATGAEVVAILNDLQAQGHALGYLDADKIRQVIPFPAVDPMATRLVIGVGTGFNAAPVFETAKGRLVAASESGHVNLPLRDAADVRLATYLAERHGFAAVEDVLSGRGLEAIYHWLGHEAGDPKEASAHEIMEGCAARTDTRAVDAVRVFVRFLGMVAGNLALIQLPFGGVYLIGGVARAVTPYMAEFRFEAAFHDKGRFAGFMAAFGVGVIEDDYAALTGSAAYLVDLAS
jgi:glucokinase